MGRGIALGIASGTALLRLCRCFRARNILATLPAAVLAFFPLPVGRLRAASAAIALPRPNASVQPSPSSCEVQAT